jgi:Zn-dependent M28 family amino/carboxypeptidase
VTVAALRGHQAALQAIADANGGTRASGTPGYDASAAYVLSQLDNNYFTVTSQPFQFPYFQELSDPEFERIDPNPRVYALTTDFLTMQYSGAGNVTAGLQAVDLLLPPAPVPSSTSGCEAADFAGFTAGRVALIQRGTCTFGEKAANAKAAGASAVIIFNEGQPGRTDVINGTLGAPETIPVIFASFDVGNELASLLDSGPVTVRVETDTISEIRDTTNVIAETKTGRQDRVVVAGAHLDSVAEGPGIQDNGSGSAAILEIAKQMAALNIQPRNRVRFTWWGAEESGLLGSEFYVSQLTARQIKNIALNLNFDMIASPNYVPFVYDGDGSDTPQAGPNGSSVIEDVFLKYFATVTVPNTTPPKPTAFDGRSDYGPFIAVGIPAGGLFTGAEGIKTADEQAVYGGTAGVAYDPCYHQACDTYVNNNEVIFDVMADAAADAVLKFAMTTSAVKGTSKANDAAVAKVSSESLQYKGSHLQK